MPPGTGGWLCRAGRWPGGRGQGVSPASIAGLPGAEPWSASARRNCQAGRAADRQRWCRRAHQSPSSIRLWLPVGCRLDVEHITAGLLATMVLFSVAVPLSLAMPPP